MRVTITYRDGTWEEIYCLSFIADTDNFTISEKNKPVRKLFPNPNKRRPLKFITIEVV